MSQSKTHGLMTVIDIFHLSVNGTVLYHEKDIHNTLHVSGEELILQALFVGGPSGNPYIPPYYFLGLDNRSSISITDVMHSLVGEPVGSGYVRQGISSTTGFTLDTTQSGNYRANSAIATFRATGSGWGPVANIFLADGNTTNDILISSAALASPVTLTAGETLSITFALSLSGSC